MILRKRVLRRLTGCVVVLGVALTPDSSGSDSAVPAVEPSRDTKYEAEIQEWRERRVAHLLADDGWLSLVGLFWLEPGTNSVGSGADQSVLLPAEKAPEQVGTMTLKNGIVVFEAASDVAVTVEGTLIQSLQLTSDAEGEPTVLDLGDLRFFVIDRGGRLAVRVKDRRSRARQDFLGIRSFPTDPLWRLSARFDGSEPGRKIPIASINGQLLDEPSPGALVFDVDGQEFRLDTLGSLDDEKLFVIFSDKTSGRDTYGGGRYLYTAVPDSEGLVELDFNKAFNPPCVFTDFATCPLPPRQNRLSIRIEAGEQNYSRH